VTFEFWFSDLTFCVLLETGDTLSFCLEWVDLCWVELLRLVLGLDFGFDWVNKLKTKV